MDFSWSRADTLACSRWTSRRHPVCRPAWRCQVQQWGELDGAEGTLVYFEPAFLDADTARVAGLHDSYAPSVIDPDNALESSLRTLAEQLLEEFDSLGELPLEVHTAVLRHLLAALVLRLSHAGDQPAGARTRAARTVRAVPRTRRTRLRPLPGCLRVRSPARLLAPHGLPCHPRGVRHRGEAVHRPASHLGGQAITGTR